MFKALIIVLYLSSEAFSAFIKYLNSSYLKKDLPDNVKDVYNEEEYKRFLSYRKESGQLGLISNCIDIALTLALLALNVFAYVFGMLSGLNYYVQYLIVIAVFTVLNTLIDLPFGYYDTFVIEEKYGLNKSTKKTFALDAVKGIVLRIVLSYALIILIKVLFEQFGNMAILWSTIAILVIVLVIMMIIMPLMRIFNKFEPLADGDLKDNLMALCDKYGVRVKKIVVRDASRRTTTSNAFCAGIGNRKTISLDDNLVNAYSTEEITAVFAHEFAHAKYRHAIKRFPFSVLSVLVAITSTAIVLNIPEFYTEFGFRSTNFYFAQMIAGVIIWPISTALGIIGNYISRKCEYQADAFAAREGYGKHLISALKRLNKESLAGINPHPAKVILDYSHPTLSQRIDAIASVSDRQGISIDKKETNITELFKDHKSEYKPSEVDWGKPEGREEL